MIFLYFILVLPSLISCFNLQIKKPTILKPVNSEIDLDNTINFGVFITTINLINNKTNILISATSSDLGNHYEKPGQIFNCEINKLTDLDQINNCKPVTLYNFIKGTNKLLTMNNFMQLGSSLTSSDKGELTFCAPGSINLYFKDHYPNGQCWFGNFNSTNYLSNFELKNQGELYLNSLYSLNLLNETKKQIYENTYFYSHGMLGFSSKIFQQEPSTIFYGAPGFNEWRGSVLQVRLYPNGQKMVNLYRHNFGSYIYFGFSLTLGNLFENKNTYCIVSAPRANSTGAVYIFKPSPLTRVDTIKEIKIKTKKILYGLTNGEYFGCSLETLDINNDGFGDLVVGSPFYSISKKQLMDNGAVYIYLGNQNDFEEPILLYGSSDSNGMFGYSIASIGDLDQDGYQDFCIGAPYENDYSGCIYIYNGKSVLLSFTHSQKICANEFEQKYRGFGINMHGSFDIDYNNYPDIIIGSYLTNNALILRSRPVGQLSSRFNFNITDINLNEKSINCFNKRTMKKTFCFELTLCQLLEIKHSSYLIEDTSIITNIHLDIFKKTFSNSSLIHSTVNTKGRAFIELDPNYQPKYKTFFTSNSSITSSFTFEYKLHPNRLTCYAPFLVFLKNEIEDKLKPILIKVDHKLNSNQDCVKDCPIIKNEKQQFTEIINFHTGCKQSKCISNFRFDVHLENNNLNEFKKINKIILGENQIIILNINISNIGEQAYSPFLELKISPSIHIKKIESRCRNKYQINSGLYMNEDKMNDKNSLDLLCSLDNPFGNENLLLQFIFDFSSEIQFFPKLFKVNSTIFTASNLSDDSQINTYLEVPIYRKVNISLKTVQPNDKFLFDFPSKETDNKIDFTNSYQIIKDGPSSIPQLEIIFDVPSVHLNYSLVKKIKFEGIDDTSIACEEIEFDNSDSNYDSLTGLLYTKKLFKSNIIAKSLIENFDEKADFIQTNDEEILFKNSTLNLNCQTINCLRYRCIIHTLGFFRQIRLFKFKASIDLNLINMLFNVGSKNFPYIKLKNDIKLTIPDNYIDLFQNFDDNKLENPSLSTITNSNYIFFQKRIEPDILSIILFSLFAGLFIFGFITFLLKKFGFFKRTKREEMQRLKQNETLLLMSMNKGIN